MGTGPGIYVQSYPSLVIHHIPLTACCICALFFCYCCPFFFVTAIYFFVVRRKALTNSVLLMGLTNTSFFSVLFFFILISLLLHQSNHLQQAAMSEDYQKMSIATEIDLVFFFLSSTSSDIVNTRLTNLAVEGFDIPEF